MQGQIKGWRYYNHAMVPDCSPEEIPDLKPILDGSIWKLPEKPLLARWTTDFDCGYETNWWYCVREAPYTMDNLSKSSRKHIRQALSKTDIKIIDQKEYATEIYRVYEEAVERYRNFVDTTTPEEFIKNLNTEKEKIYWGAFDKESGILVAYMIIQEKNDYVNLCTAKFSTRFLRLQASTAMYHVILEYYLNERKFRYVNSGERNINHETNTQEYKIAKFGYKKAFCSLSIAYAPRIKYIIKFLYPIRSLLKLVDGINFVHKINAVLKMEEIVRSEKKK